MKEILREILRASEVEDLLIDLILEGEKIDEPNHVNVNPDFWDIDFSAFLGKMNVFEELGLGDSIAFAVDGKYAKSGKPILITAIEDQNT